MIPYNPPKFDNTSYNCPHCHAHAEQKWGSLMFHSTQFNRPISGYRISLCEHCKKVGIWENKALIYPESLPINHPNEDLNDDIKADFNEASLIIYKSPRGAAALYRLCIQKLCIQLGQSGVNINNDIAALVKKGLNPLIQKSLDIVRVLGNEAVHPGQIDLRDNPDIAIKIAQLVNIIADVMISQPKHINKMYNDLPKSKIDQIQKRDINK